jgi:succinate dehydrogenase/fumarate reductase flavoprotein subunit
MDELSADILVIGSGLAGMVAALEAEESGLKVALVGKIAIGLGTNSSISGGGFMAAGSKFSEEDHLRATLESGKGLSELKLVKILVENGPRAIETLRNYGVPFVERRIGYRVDRPEGSSQASGILLARALRERLKQNSIQTIPGLTLFDLVVEEGEARGAFGFFRDGKPCLIHSKAVILAAGGAGAIYRRNDNQKSILGDGYGLALRAGLSLLDLEFVQFYPFVLAEPRLSTFILYTPFPKEARVFNEKGEDLLAALGVHGDLNQAVLSERDRISVHLYEASRTGDVYFDYTQVPNERWERFPLNFLKRSRFQFRERPFLVSPAAHFFMGGIQIDGEAKTAIPGLFAAGEVAWGIHGANRHGGNALTECTVFGTLASQSAVAFVREKERGQTQPTVHTEAVSKKWERRAKGYLRKRRGVFDHPRDLLKGLRSLTWRSIGPVREESTLREGLDLLASVEERAERIYAATVRDLFRKRELENAVLITKAILRGSLLREESRGAFCRKDFPRQDDQAWLKHTCYRLHKGKLEITHLPITPSSLPIR